jgi:hypothetical protein
MWRTFWIVSVWTGLLACGLIWLASTSTFLFRHPKAPDERIVIDSVTGQPVVVRKVAEFAAANAIVAAGQMPQVETPTTKFDFGISDPLTRGSHQFVIRNVGQAPLRLETGKTSCKCTVGGLEKRELAPGEEGLVTLEWTTGRDILFSHYALIRTNDPERAELEFRVSGKVRVQLGTSEPELIVPAVNPGDTIQASTIVYSQTAADLAIKSVDAALPGFAWTAETMVGEALHTGALEELGAASAQRLVVTIPTDELRQEFSDTLRLTVESSQFAEPQTLELPLYGQVLGRVAVFSPLIDADGIVDFGTLQHGVGAEAKLLVKIRDAETSLGEVQIETFPDFVTATLEPRAGAGKPVTGKTGAGKGLYDLRVTIPADTPVCQYLGTPQGWLKIRTSHPRVSEIEVKLHFAVKKREFR